MASRILWAIESTRGIIPYRRYDIVPIVHNIWPIRYGFYSQMHKYHNMIVFGSKILIFERNKLVLVLKLLEHLVSLKQNQLQRKTNTR